MAEIRSRVKGYVAYIDLLGFSELVKQEDFMASFDKYTAIIETELKSDITEFQYIIFSDSLIVNTESDAPEVFLSLIESLSHLNYRLLLEMNLPLCGCVSFGDFSRAEKKGNAMIAGTPIVEAVEYEKKQDWIGIMLSPSVCKIHEKIRYLTYISRRRDVREIYDNLSWSQYIQRYNDIPFENGSYDGFVIVPVKEKPKNIALLQESLAYYRAKLDELKLYAPTRSSQNKYLQTSAFAQEIYKRWESATVARRQWVELLDTIQTVDFDT